MPDPWQVYDPVCGSDDITYTSTCHLEQAGCQTGTNVTAVHGGQCGLVYGDYSEDDQILCPASCPPVSP